MWKFIRHLPAILLLTILFSACSLESKTESEATTAQDATVVFQELLQTETAGVPTALPTRTITATSVPTATVTPSPTVMRTPPALPSAFTSPSLNPNDEGVAYITDPCIDILNKWSSDRAQPGTVVMPIMFHRITDGDITQPYQITAEAVRHLLINLKDQGFESITIQELANYLHRNERIPQRSFLLIVDDLHTEQYYRDHFEPLLKEYGWTMVNAWISEPSAMRAVLAGNQLLQQEGWVDHQAHGVVHNINISEEISKLTFVRSALYGDLRPDDFMRRELEGSRDAILREFGKVPIAYIWPGGNWSARGLELAHEAGYELGFTVNPRGPLMYNWIPQGRAQDPGRPVFIAEGPYQDPLLLLPRYWDIDASGHIDTVRQIGKAAQVYAESNKAIELEYYDIVCREEYGQIQ